MLSSSLINSKVYATIESNLNPLSIKRNITYNNNISDRRIP